ncbi:uncharacterized protein [Ptychodera flava]|uniref:uncharacterized protein n=1 Tax=Ptychodera flava TaxID=63121 RepID=UPI00396A96AF
MLRTLMFLQAILFVTSLEVVVNEQQDAESGDLDAILYCSYSGVPDAIASIVVEWKKLKDDGIKKFLVRKVMTDDTTTSIDIRYIDGLQVVQEWKSTNLTVRASDSMDETTAPANYTTSSRGTAAFQRDNPFYFYIYLGIVALRIVDGAHSPVNS